MEQQQHAMNEEEERAVVGLLEYAAEYRLEEDAVFYAQLLRSLSPSDSAVYRAASVLASHSNPHAARILLDSRPDPKCRYLYARVCCDLAMHDAAEAVLVDLVASVDTLPQPLLCAVYACLGSICSRSHRTAQSIEHYRNALRINPMLYSAIDAIASQVLNLSRNDINRPEPRTQEGHAPNRNLSDSSIALRRSARIPISQHVTKTNSAVSASRDKKRTRSGHVKTETKELKDKTDLNINFNFTQPPKLTPMDFTKDSGDPQKDILQTIQTLFLSTVSYRFYRIPECIQQLAKLHSKFETNTYVCSLKARCLFEKAQYEEAEKVYRLLIRIDPLCNGDVDLFSTVLWQLRKESELSHLAQEMLALDKRLPQTWCVVGNSYSLRKDHDSALKCFRRAIQLDEYYAYAYNLCGHEYHSTDDFEQAQNYFRQAIRLKKRLYNAWFGLGMIYYKQEKYDMAEFHLRKALHINPHSTVLNSTVGMVLQKLRRYGDALILLDKAIQADGKNPQAKYRKALCLIDLGRYSEAIGSLHEVLTLAPREANVCLKLGAVYKQVGEYGKAMTYYMHAMELDVKCTGLVKEAIERIHSSDLEMVDKMVEE